MKAVAKTRKNIYERILNKFFGGLMSRNTFEILMIKNISEEC